MRGMTKMKRIISVIVALTLLLCFSSTVSAAQIENITYDSYTYWQDNSGSFLVGNRPMYEVKDTIFAADYNISNLNEPTDIAVNSFGDLYILDSNNARIVILDKELKLKSIISDFGGEKFDKAMGIEISYDDKVYIADTENMRVLVADSNGSLIEIIKCPDSEIIPDDYEFRPLQLSLDKNGYLYVLSKGSYYGALVFAPDGTTEGFFGATKVNASIGDVFDLLWNRWFLTDAQRASQIQKIPYQFSDLCIDGDGLVYTTTGATKENAKGQIRALGPTGQNVLKSRVGRVVSSADGYNFADNGVAKLAIGSRLQDFVSIDVQDGIIYALDQTYGKVFVYSDNCELYTVFGGGVKKGTQLGTFQNAVSLAVYENNVYVLDSKKGNITVFSLNEYGSNLFKASALTNKGEYLNAKPLWESIIKLDRNNQLAYRGLARAELAEKNYSQAMKYAKQGWDRGIYDQAFEYVRNDFIEKYIDLFILLVILIPIAIFAVFMLNKRKKLVNINLPKTKLATTAFLHPFENFRAVKYNAQGSMIVASVFLILYYLTDVLRDYYSGFVHSTFNVEDYNSLLSLLGTVGVVVLWVVCNWGMSVLAEGKAKIKEVYIVACYSLIPQIFNSIFYLIGSNVLLESEATILTVVSTVCLILTGITLCIGTMIIHEFDFFKFIFTAVLSLIAMAVVIFILFMIVILVQQFYEFIRTILIEVIYR